jgi:predicted amidophosphoribosyltransferase
MKRLVSAHKEHQVLTLTPVLAGRLAVAVEHLLSAGPRLPPAASVVLVPVPSSPAAVRARGLDATWAMARGAARRCRPSGVVGAERLLTLARRIQDQAGLGAAERRENLRESLRAAGRGLGPGCVALIVDDVVTTGSSLTEARRALRAARIPVLGAATVAATVRSRAGSPWDELRGEAARKTEGRR